MPIALVAGVLAWPHLKDGAQDIVANIIPGVDIVGEGGMQFMVAASASSEVYKCTPQKSLSEEACEDLKFIIFDAAKMPFITRNISEAWRAGKSGVLTKDTSVEGRNRKEVCLPTFPKPYGGQCDEYPFASTRQGGRGAREMEVPPRENQCQGGTISSRYARFDIQDGDDYLVVITHPDQIAKGPYQGIDIAEEKEAC